MTAWAGGTQPAQGFGSRDGRPRGGGGQIIARRAPSLFNRAYGTSFFWDGRAATLEEQALKPIENPTEMGSSVADAVQRLTADKEYPAQFQAAFPDGVTAATLGRPLAGRQARRVADAGRRGRSRQSAR